MAFTAQELENIANATLDFHVKKVKASNIQNKPLKMALERRAKAFPGGKDSITERVKGVTSTALQGYTHNDAVAYGNPANIKLVTYPWKELHAGITVTLTELKANGISIVDTENGRRESQHSQSEMIQLVNLLEDKLDDMQEGYDSSFHKMMWRDGTQDAKEIPGVRSLILDAPATPGQFVGALATDTNAWWRNRATLGINTGTTDLDDFFQKEFRQLGRYARNPSWEIFAGADFLEALEKRLRAKGLYTQGGWTKEGGLDISMSDVKFKSARFQYDPMLDDLALNKHCYVLDMGAIKLRPMEGEAAKKHNPARPATQYAIYRAVTYTGGLTANQLNSSGVYSIL